MSELKKIIFTKDKTEKEIQLKTDNPYINFVKLVVYNENGNIDDSISSHEIQINYKTNGAEFIEGGISLTSITFDKEFLVNSNINVNWNKTKSINVKIHTYDDQNYKQIELYYQDFNLIENQDSKKDFSTHLEDFKNQKILFSAPFGEGKSTFLKYFFEQNEDKYEVFKVFPVNYSVASNEDIFRYIKADILFQMMGKGVEFKKEEFSTELTAQQYVVSNFGQIAKSLLKAGLSISSKTEEIVKAINEIEKLIGGFETFKSGLEQDDESQALKYIEELYEQEGSIFEDNFYTQLIRELVEQLKSQKETVLIIDDLDRMDPDHIFRILNVISAHCDTYNIQGEEFHNKFGFDKIILVCDIDNIRSIFEHRYGKDVDFNGYINKFYSSGVFEFDSKYVIKYMIEDFKNVLMATNKSEYSDALELLLYFNSKKLISVRQMIAIRKELDFKSIRKRAYESVENNYPDNYCQSLFFAVLYVMSRVYHTKEKLIDVLNTKIDKVPYVKNLNFYCVHLLSALGKQESSGIYGYELEGKKLFYDRNLRHNYSVKIGNTLEEAKEKDDYIFSKEDFYTLLIENIKLL